MSSREIRRYIFLGFDGSVWREQTRGVRDPGPCGFRFAETEDPGPPPRQRWRAFDRSDETDPRWPDAVIYREVAAPPYYDQVPTPPRRPRRR